jgi:lipopolysaccharide biosynthesis glycosyltransferase
MESIRLLIGWDDREAVGSHVFLQSVIERCSLPLEVTILTPRLLDQLGIGTDGSNAFTKARFLAPYLNRFSGYVLFVDGADMLCLGDLAEVWALQDHYSAVQVVQHDYKPQSAKKYIGTDLESDNVAYPRKNWSSMILWHCGFAAHRILTPEYINKMPGQDLHRFNWIPNDRIGWLPKEWNVLIGEDNQSNKVKLAHYTNGIVGFSHYKDAECAKDWREAWLSMNKGLQYQITEHSGR